MIKKAQGFKMRCLAVAMVSLFALFAQLLVSRNASAIADDQISAFETCMEKALDSDDGLERDNQAQAINDCVKPIGLAWGEAEALCSDNKYQEGVYVEKCNSILGRRVKTDPESLGARQEGAVTPLDNKCVSSNRAIAWFGCSVIDSTSNTITRVYSSIVEDWLVFKPEILSAAGNPHATGTYKIWSAIRVWANLLFVILIIIIAYSHITGIETQAYGLKKILPKLIITAVLVNLSYYICQIAIDLCNILGSGIGRFFMGLSERVDLDSVGGFAGMSNTAGLITVVIIVIIGIIVGLLATGPAIFIPVLLTIVGGMLTIFFTYAMLVVRQALIILAVVVSPVAIAFSALPNTTPIFRKWFNLLRGLLITYPLASLLIYGGNYGARVILKVWDSDGLIPSMVALAVCILPITMLPKLAQSSIAAIDRMMLKAQNGINGFARRRITDNRLADRANEIQKQKQLRRAAGVVYDKKTGQLSREIRTPFRGKSIKIPRPGLIGASMDFNLRDAEAMTARERHIQFLQDQDGSNGQQSSFDQLSFNTELKAVDASLAARGQMSVQTMQTELESVGGSTLRDNAMAFALSKRLFESGEAGRDALRESMARKATMSGLAPGVAGPPARNLANEAWMRSVCSSIASQGDDGKNYDPRLMSYATNVVNNPTSAIDNFGTYRPPASVYNGLSGEKIAKMDTSTLRSLHGDLSGMLNSGDASQIAQANNIISSAGRLLQSSDRLNLTMEKRRIVDQINSLRI